MPVFLWDIASGGQPDLFLGHENTLTALTFSADGRYLASGDDEGVVRIWRMPTETPAAGQDPNRASAVPGPAADRAQAADAPSAETPRERGAITIRIETPGPEKVKELQNSPGPIQPSARLVGATTILRPGDFVHVLWSNSWYRGQVMEARGDGTVKIHYVGWADHWDEVVGRSRLRLP